MAGDRGDYTRPLDDDAEDELETRVRRGSGTPSTPPVNKAAEPPPPKVEPPPAIRPWMPGPEDERRGRGSTPAEPEVVVEPVAEARAEPVRYTIEATPRYAPTRTSFGSIEDEEPPSVGDRGIYAQTAAYGGQAEERPRTGGNGCAWVAGLALLIVLACGLLFFGALRSGFEGLSGMVPRFPALPLQTPQTIIETNRPSVIEQIRPLGRLETTQYTIEKVIPGESTGALPPFTTDKILFVAHGEVIAGIDLGKIAESDIVVVSDTVTITLPAAEVLVSRLDNEKSYVYNRETGLFAKTDPNLESEVRRIAESEILQAAIEGGILQQAQQNAETTLRTLILALGYEEVVFKTRGAPVYATPTP